jgi:hypothetical protein
MIPFPPKTTLGTMTAAAAVWIPFFKKLLRLTDLSLSDISPPDDYPRPILL